MLVSMTGFGSAAGTESGWSVKVEARSVNHRYADLLVRLPKGYHSVEEKVRHLVGAHVTRGRVEIFLEIEEIGTRDRTVKLDRALLQGYVQALREAESEIGTSFVPNVDMLINLPNLFVVEEFESDPERVWPLLERVVNEALRSLVTMRRSEGSRLEEEILGRMRRLSAIVAEISSRAPDSVVRYRERLTTQVERLLSSVPVDEQRLAQEIALYADKSDISEEITRAKSHIDQFVQTCGTDESVGRKLDFLIQELNREVNTVASKAQDVSISNLVVEAKSELEKVREQVQNVE